MKMTNKDMQSLKEVLVSGEKLKNQRKMRLKYLKVKLKNSVTVENMVRKLKKLLSIVDCDTHLYYLVVLIMFLM